VQALAFVVKGARGCQGSRPKKNNSGVSNGIPSCRNTYGQRMLWLYSPLYSGGLCTGDALALCTRRTSGPPPSRLVEGPFALDVQLAVQHAAARLRRLCVEVPGARLRKMRRLRALQEHHNQPLRIAKNTKTLVTLNKTKFHWQSIRPVEERHAAVEARRCFSILF